MQDDICFVLVEDEPLILGQLEYSVIACDPHFAWPARREMGATDWQKLSVVSPML